MKVAIFGKYYAELHSFNRLILKELEERSVEISICRNFHAIIKEFTDILKDDIEIVTEDNLLNQNVDFVISIGGDGTFLKTITVIKDSGIPIIGINAGRLGFLAQITQEEIGMALDCILEKNYTVEHRQLIRMMPETEYPWFDFPCALNEVTIQKKDSALITMHVEVDGVHLNSYWADGLIFSTPTGSTAYSLSVGGPIVAPDCKNIIISPVSPHNLTMRPLVLGGYKEIRVYAESRNGLYIATMDSRNITIQRNMTFSITPTDFTINLIQLPQHNFYNTLRTKLMWGADKRN